MKGANDMPDNPHRLWVHRDPATNLMWGECETCGWKTEPHSGCFDEQTQEMADAAADHMAQFNSTH